MTAPGRWPLGLAARAVLRVVRDLDPVEEARQLARPDRVAELADRLGLDLTDALAGHAEGQAHLLEGVGVAVTDAVPELDDLALAEGEGRSTSSIRSFSISWPAAWSGLSADSSSMKSPK